MSQIKNSNVLITGGAQGIGKLLGEKCLREGAKNLIIWDINPVNIDQTLADFNHKGYKNVHAFRVDVSDNNEIEKAATEVLLEIGNVDILFNNAGIVVGKMFWEHTAEEIDRTIQINLNGVLHTTRVFIKEMIQQKRGHVINIASASGMISNKKMSAYLASKWAVKGWSDSLRMELESLGGDLHVTTVCPSYINTGMFKGVKAPFLFPLLEPEDITDQIIRAVKKNQIFLLAPSALNLIPFLQGILPTRLFDVAAEFLGVYDSMTDFEGRDRKEAVPSKKSKQTI
ncbi:MAG TPA: SDR family oxidoreductase [Chitinophagales bacterium]|nr:SDR family oxidoreductase [Chitinophagales bacterium]